MAVISTGTTNYSCPMAHAHMNIHQLCYLTTEKIIKKFLNGVVLANFSKVSPFHIHSLMYFYHHTEKNPKHGINPNLNFGKGQLKI